MRLSLCAAGVALLGLAGCLPPESHSQLVTENPFGGPPVTPPPSRAPFAPATTESAARVDALGRSILAANPQVGVKPLFRTIGTPDSEVFHHGTAEIDITEGLVRQCRTDGQLAAVLCLELGQGSSPNERPWPPRRSGRRSASCRRTRAWPATSART